MLVIFYSGEGSKSNPEITLGDEANLMLTYHDFHARGSRPTNRFKRILKKRKESRDEVQDTGVRGQRGDRSQSG